ncbi:MAG: DEAD/DEAH box helicase, partial [Desulfobacterales bacterium]|nr:DEAD/DEAH box helicase [Desulfobacterales bacterium]
MKFETYPISSEIKRNLTQAGLIRPTDIQYKAIPSILRGEDVLAVAQTGTGKTVAFAVPVIHKIHQAKSSRRHRGIQCIVMVPTRELAGQIGRVFESLCFKTKVNCFALYGGVEQDAQIKRLNQGVDILVATPGRMFDLISQGAVNTRAVTTLILDEADQMLDRGFIKDIQDIKRRLKQRHQTLFFSATINRQIKKLAFSQVKSNAIRIQISPEDPVSKNVHHQVAFIEMDDKRFFLRGFITHNADKRIMVFVRTKVRAERVAKALERGGIDSFVLHGGKDQAERDAVMADFRDHQGRILIATDVSARGIDIPDVDYVINYDLPDQAENYVHRVGRTGRGRRKGRALSFCAEGEKELLKDIQGFLNREIEVLHLTRREYGDILEDSRKPESLREMILDHETREKEAWKKARKRR